jgi:alkylhydroperoxidase family enzyme
LAVINWADLVTRGAAAVTEPVLEELGKHFSSDEIVEMTFGVALANFNNRMVEALLVDLDDL